MAPLPDDPILQEALIGTESNFDPTAVSSKGAFGLTQITPQTWETFAQSGEDPGNPDDQKKVGIRILSDYYDKFNGDISLGLAAYNHGPANIRKYLDETGGSTFEDISSHLPEETKKYVPKVLGKYEKLKGEEQPDYTNLYNTELTSEEEINYQKWLKDFSKKTGRDRSKDTFDYDLRGFFKSGQEPGKEGHLTDQFKKPNHPTFSNESIYSGAELPNGETAVGGQWNKDTFIPPLKSEQPNNISSFTGEPGTVDEFNHLIGLRANTPGFFSQPPEDQLATIGDIYRSREWHDPQVDQQVKELSSLIWDSAKPGELPQIGSIVGAPPMLQKTEDVDKAINGWKDDTLQSLRDKGIMPELFGKQLDDYMTFAGDQEKSAYTTRNRSSFDWGLNRAGNLVRETAKGVVSLVTSPLAGVARLGGAPFGAGKETADYLDSRPAVWLGQPADDFLYYTDENGYPVQNEDGSFKTHWQAQAAEGVGAIGAAIGTLGIGAVAGVSRAVLSAAAIGTNTLSLANSSFKTVYDKTGSLQSAYTAAAFALPAGAIGSIGELGIISGAFRPALKGLTAYDQARFLATSFGKNAFVNAVAGGSQDVVQQLGEISQTGDKFNTERTAVATGVGAVGGGLAGAAVDLVAGRRALFQNQATQAQYKNEGSKEIYAFRNGLPSQRIINTPIEHLDTGDLQKLGIDATKTQDGKTLLTKKLSFEATTPVTADELGSLTQGLKNYYTPNEILQLGKEHADLAEKGVRSQPEQERFDNLGEILVEAEKPEYLNNLKTTEERVAQSLRLQPDASLVQYNHNLGKWENVETGQTFDYAKDALFPNDITKKYYRADLSDISRVNIIDEETLPSLEVSQKALTDHETSIANLSAELLNLKKENTSIDEGLLPVKNKEEIQRLQADQERLRQQIQTTEELVPKTEQEKNSILNKKEARTAIDRKLLTKKNKALRGRYVKQKKKLSVEIQELENSMRRFTEQVQGLRALREKDAALEQKLSQYPERQIVQSAKAKQREIGVNQDKIRNRITELRARTSGFKKAISERQAIQSKIEKIRGQGLGGRVVTGGKQEIIIPKNASPDVKAEVLAHEVAHVVSDELSLTTEADAAVKAALLKVQDKGAVLTPKELAAEFYLPNIAKAVNVPEAESVSKLTRSSKDSLDSLFSKREFVANQIAAVMLERSGRSIGNYKVLPEIRTLLEDTKLPTLESKTQSPTQVVEEPKVHSVKSEVTEPVKSTEPSRPPVSESEPQVSEAVKELSKGEAPVQPSTEPSRGPGKLFDYETGEQGETALSQTLREAQRFRGVKEADLMPKVYYDKVSRIKGIAAADVFIKEVGLPRTREILSSPESISLDPRQHELLSEAYFRAAGEELGRNPSPENKDRFFEAEQLNAHSKSISAQVLSLGQRFRGTESFADFVSEVNKALRVADEKPADFTDLQIKELKLLYDRAQALPSGSLRNNYVQKLFLETLGTQKISPAKFWGSYLKNSMQGNLLSGVGTSVINVTGGVWMGPLFTALSHPVMGRGLVWRNMIETIRNGTAFAQAKLVMEGKAANAMYGGIYDPTGLEIRDYSTLPRSIASYQNKFGTGIFRVLGAADSFMKTISGEGYTAYKQYSILKERYPNDPAKFTSEVAKIMIPRADIEAAKVQAEAEGKTAGIKLTEADKAVRAFEILRQRDVDPAIISEAGDWANATSLRGELANPVQQVLHRLLYAPNIWEKHPLINAGKTVIFPFGRALIALSDFALDFVPGNYLAEKGLRYSLNKFKITQTDPRSPALQQRGVKAQIVGTALATTFLAMARSGTILITGDPEQVLDRGGEGDSTGKAAKTRAQFKEFEQKGEAPFTVYFPKLDKGFSYKDIPGLNALMYGLYQTNKLIDGGASLPVAAGSFFWNAYTNALPLMGVGTLNSPYVNLVSELMDPEVTEERAYKALSKVGVSASKMAIPGSSLLRDVKNLYDSTPEETNQSFTMQVMANIPVISELSGSKPALNRFGKPVERTSLERVPGVGRVIEEKKVPTDPTMYQLYQKGLIIPELQSRIKIDKSDYGSPLQAAQYTKTREDRLGGAYAKMLTPDEWYSFIQATGPYIESVAKQILSANLPAARAQMLLLDRVKAIEDQAMKRYIRTGKFVLQ